jgi:putative ABC transport system ATP-binding protein
MTKIVRLQEVKKVLSSGNRSTTALNGVNLEIEEGGFISIIGPSGSGKSTLIDILSGLEKPTEGHVEISKMHLDSLKEKDLHRWRKNNIGMVSKEDKLISSLTALENVVLPVYFSDKFNGDIMEEGKKCLDFVGMSEIADKFPFELSEEERRGVSLARSIVNDPIIITGDEPEGNLNSQSSEKIFKILEKINRTGKTVIFVTHNTHFAIRSKRMITLLDGKVVRS